MGAALCEVGKVWPVTQSGYTTVCSRHSDNHKAALRSSEENWQLTVPILHCQLTMFIRDYKKKHLLEHWGAVMSSTGSYVICIVISGNDVGTGKFQHICHLCSESLSLNFSICRCEISCCCFFSFCSWVTIQGKYVHRLLLTTTLPDRNQWLIHQAFQYWCGCVSWTSRGQPSTGNTQQQRKSV